MARPYFNKQSFWLSQAIEAAKQLPGGQRKLAPLLGIEAPVRSLEVAARSVALARIFEARQMRQNAIENAPNAFD